MDGIKIQVTGNIAKVTEKPKRIIAGTIGLPVEFFFDETWDDIVKTAVFVAGENVSRLDEIDGKTTVPWEVLQNPGPWLSIGVYGESSDGEKSIPTTWANVSPILFGTSLSGDPTDPSAAPIWQKLKDEMENVKDLVEEGYISNASINKKGELELTFLDGSVVNVGRVDGVSPIVSITEISGGHRVTITDENSTKTFDVMNGKDAIVNIVDNLGSSDPNAALSARMGGVLKTKIEDDVSALNEQLQPQINQRVKTVNGVAPDKNGNVNVEGGGGSGAGVYIGSTQPTDGSLYWLDTSDGVNDEPVKYTVSTILENVTIDNTAESVNEGASFAATLTVGDDYVIQEVSVIMGGVDVTSVAYVGDSIYIGSVVGDIVITATAIARADTGTMWSITNNLANVTSDNTALSVADGNAYTANLTVGSGYKIDSVTITMGGTDVTATVYADGVITIATVTGDVVITATAVVKDPYLDDESNIYATSETSVGLYIDYADAVAKFPSDNIYLYFKAPDAYKTKINVVAFNYQTGKITNATTIEDTFGVAHYDHRKESGYVVQVFSLSKLKDHWDGRIAEGLTTDELERIYFQVPVAACLPLKVLYNYAE